MRLRVVKESIEEGSEKQKGLIRGKERQCRKNWCIGMKKKRKRKNEEKKTDSTISKTISTASETGSTAAAAGGQEKEEDPEIIPETPNEEADEERTRRLPPLKKRKTRNTIKEENVSITAPMVEVSGPDGAMMVFRPWTVNDMKEAMAHLPNPEEAGDRFSIELITFCKEFSPTMYELRRLLAVKLGASKWHKVSGKLRGEDYRRVSSSWTDETNANYCTAVVELVEGIKVAFPVRVDTSRIGNCCQTREESVQDYYHRLYETFNKHSGLEEPDDRGNQPDTWECHLRSWFLNGLRPEIVQEVKCNYIEWKNGRLTAISAHALHAEEQQTMKKER
ncbi:hypothetical protein M9458_050303, partial [Cirrhinus mrigala]